MSSVSDAVTVNNHLGDFYDGNTSDNDYTYDLNGNLTSDKNKAISSITYDYLNLPEVVTITGKGTITYLYDAAGNKLKKTVIDQTVTPNKTTVTTYIGGFVYQNDTLQFISHEEGRIRYLPSLGGAGGGWVYDYFEKDNLGNVRMVLTEKQDTSFYPAATMETAQATTEEALYANLPETRTPISTVAGYPTDNTTFPNNEVAEVSGNGQKIGPSIVLKVMAGDRLNIKVSSWYKLNGATPNSPNSIATDLVTSLINSLAGVANAAHGNVTSTELQNSGIIPTSADDFLNTQPDPGATKPKAYLNWVLLDEQFKFVQNGSGAEQVGDDGVFTVHVKTNLPVTKNGYLYVYVSNETPNIDVFFDNLQVTHIHGQILEETHYYPFGLTMAGISSKAAGSLANKRKFVSQELDDDLGLNLYQFKFRNHDPQIGRFIEIDPLADKYPYNSTYAYAENRPTSGIDLEGLEFWCMVWNVITDPGNAPGHIGTYIAQKQSEYSESVRATARLATGTSGEVNHPGGSSPVEKSLTKTIGTLQDINSASQPYVDVLETTNTLASLTPIGEAGAATEVTNSGLKIITTEQSTAAEATIVTKSKPSFLVDQSGQAFLVPKNAEGPVPVINKNGNVTGSAFTGGKSGTNGNVTSVRVMNPNSKNANGYVKYYNDAQPKQGVDPYSGKTLPNNQNHFELNLWWNK